MNNNTHHKKDIHTEKIRVGRRTYFFDLKENAEGEKYLVITESKAQKEEGFRRDRIMVFTEYMDDFVETFNKMLIYLEKEKVSVE